MVSSHSGWISMGFHACLPCEARACSRCSTWAPCGDHCYDLYQCPSFQYACLALKVLAHRPRYLFALRFHSRLVLVVGDVDTHFGGVVRCLVVGRLSWSPVGVRKTQRYGGNSAEEGANEPCQAASAPRTLRTNNPCLRQQS
jgi:hypothetical protein